MKTSKTSGLNWQNKLIATALAATMLFIGSPQSTYATLPNIGSSNLTISAGAATVSQSTLSSTLPESMTVQASTSNVVLNWGSFSDGTSLGGQLSSNDTIYFNTLTGGAILNNITGSNASVLGGSIRSNGNLFFLNPNGIVIGATSNINVQNLYISTIQDPGAASYFYSNGTLGTFSNVPQLSTVTSGIIYVQSGAQIQTAPGNGSVYLSSAYNGSGITVNGSVGANTALSGSVLTVNAGAAVSTGSLASAQVSGINVDNVNLSGSLYINSTGAGSSVVTGNNAYNGINSNGITLTQGYPTNGGSIQGGNLSILTNGGSVTINGPVSAAGTGLISTTTNSGLTPTGAITLITGNVSIGSTLSLSTRNADISLNASDSNSSSYGLTTGGNTTVQSGSGNIKIYGDLASSTSITGNTVTISSSNPVGTTRTFSQITSAGTLTINAVGNLKLINVVTGNGITVNSWGGSASVGDSSALSTINGSVQSTISAKTIATLETANVNIGTLNSPSLVLQSTNSTLGANSGTNVVKISNVNTTGNVFALANTASNSTGDILIQNTNLYSASSQIGDIIAKTGNGSVSLSTVYLPRGSITINANNDQTNLTTPVQRTITLTSVNNNSPAGLISDNFYTTNGGIAFKGYVSSTQNVIAFAGTSEGKAVSTGNKLGDLTVSGVNSFGGSVSLTTNNGAITMTGLSMTGTSVSRNSVTLVSNTINQNINYTVATGDLYVAGISGAGLGTGLNDSTTGTTVTLASTTGNLWLAAGNNSTGYNSVVTPGLVAPVISLTAGGALNTVNVQTTRYLSSAITISSGTDINVNQMGSLNGVISFNQGPVKTLSLTSTTGNINLTSTNQLFTNNNGTSSNVPSYPNLTLSAITGNVVISSAVTSNGLSLTAGNTISQGSSTDYGITNISTGSASINAPTVNLVGTNILPNVKLLNGSNGITLNSSSLTTTNISNGTSTLGNVTITTNGPVSIGSASTDSITIGGNLAINTGNSASTNGVITTVSTAPNLFGGVTLNTNSSSVTLGTSGGNANFGTLNITTGPSTAAVIINENNVSNLGNITASTLSVTAPSIINNTGVVSATTANLNASTSVTTISADKTTYTTVISPGSVTLGTLNPTNITQINVTAANAVSINANSKTYVMADNLNLSNLVLNNNNTNQTSGSLIFTQNNGIVQNVTGYTNAGILTYTALNSPLTTGTLTTNTGGLVITSDGTGASLGTTSFALNNYTAASSIKNNGSWTINNLTSSSGAGNATLCISANAIVGGANSGAQTLTIGSGINLQGQGAVTFTTGNAQDIKGSISNSITDLGTSNLTINSAATTTFVGKTISVTSPTNSIGIAKFTTNGSISYTTNGNMLLSDTTIYGAGSGTNYFTSLTGNISEVGTGKITTYVGAASPLVFTASSTGNNGVNLGNANSIFANAKTTISISASGNSALVTNNDVYLGTVNIVPSVGSGPTDSQLIINTSSATDPRGSISQGSSSIYVWGNVSLTSKKDVILTNAGNNFGSILVSASSGNTQLTEAATSVYSSVATKDFTAVSKTGDILSSASGSTASTITGNSSLTATKGQITLNTSGSNLAGTSNYIYFNALNNVTLVDNRAITLLQTGSTTGGNLSVTNGNAGLISDQAGSSGINVTGIASFTSAGGSINLSGLNNSLGGVYTRSTQASVKVLGNLVLAPGSQDTYAYFTSTNGNISTSGVGGSSYNYLTLSAPLGNVIIANPTSISGGLTITSGGKVDLSVLSNAVDLASGTVIPSVISTGNYTPPSP